MKLCDQPLERELKEHLLALPFQAFLHALSDLLARLGYSQIELSGRVERVGRNRDGGYDLLAYLPVPGGARRVVIQAKQYPLERMIYRHTVDELRGVCLRAGAAEAVLITTSGFSDTVNRPRLAAAAIAPVRLIDGSELAELMALHRIGVWEEAPSSSDQPARRGLDARYFAELTETHAKAGRPAAPEQLSLVFSLLLRPRRKKRSAATPKRAALPRRS